MNTIEFNRKAISLIPENLCKKYTLIPFGFENNRIKVTLADPLNIFAIDDVAISTGFEIESFISRKADINILEYITVVSKLIMQKFNYQKKVQKL